MSNEAFAGALVRLAQGCAVIREASWALAESACDGTDEMAQQALAACRDLLLDALESAPGLRDLLVVPATREVH